MITINRKLARRLGIVFRKAAGRNNPFATVRLATDGSALHVQCRSTPVSVEFRAPHDGPNQTLVIPFSALSDFEGPEDSVVELKQKGRDMIVAEWSDGGVPQRRTYEKSESEPLDQPKTMTKIPSVDAARFFGDLDALGSCAAQEDSRYALSRIQIRGAKGEMVSTDGKQILILGGYEFPFEENVLIPTSQVFGAKELRAENCVEIGSTKDHIVIRTDHWTVWLQRQEGRFPVVDDLIPKSTTSKTRLRLDPADTEFLAGALPKLPGDQEYNSPIALDLNGQVVIRALDKEQDQATELVLSRSNTKGPVILLHTNRRYVRRALDLGFTEFHLTNDKTPVLGTAESRQYLWMPLSSDPKENEEKPASNVIRIDSAEAVAEETKRPNETNKKKGRAMPRQTSTNDKHDPQTNGTANDPTAELIEKAEKVKETLKEGIGQVNDLVASLKQQKKQSKAVHSTLSALRQLVA